MKIEIKVDGKLVELSQETINNIRNSIKPILVPENIKITKRWCDCSYGLQFGNKQELYWNYETIKIRKSR